MLCCNYDEMNIGPTPAEEPCQQVGTDKYDPAMAKAECRRYIAHLRIKYGQEPEGASFRVKPNQHDFGTYYEVVCRYEADNQTAVEYAFKVEGGLGTWLPEGPTMDDIMSVGKIPNLLNVRLNVDSVLKSKGKK